MKKLTRKNDPGQQEFQRAKKQAREKTQKIHRVGRQLYRESTGQQERKP